MAADRWVRAAFVLELIVFALPSLVLLLPLLAWGVYMLPVGLLQWGKGVVSVAPSGVGPFSNAALVGMGLVALCGAVALSVFGRASVRFLVHGHPGLLALLRPDGRRWTLPRLGVAAAVAVAVAYSAMVLAYSWSAMGDGSLDRLLLFYGSGLALLIPAAHLVAVETHRPSIAS